MNRTYDIDGPELLSGLGLAQAASRGLGGVPIRYTNCTREEFVQFLIDSGNARNPAHLENVMAVLDAVAENRYSDTDANKIRELFGKWYAPRRIAENFDERKEEITRLLERAAPVNADNERHGEKAEVVDAFDPDHPSQRWWRPTPSRDVGIAMTAQQWNQVGLWKDTLQREIRQLTFSPLSFSFMDRKLQRNGAKLPDRHLLQVAETRLGTRTPSFNKV